MASEHNKTQALPRVYTQRDLAISVNSRSHESIPRIQDPPRNKSLTTFQINSFFSGGSLSQVDRAMNVSSF
jgi:hypothetical protein